MPTRPVSDRKGADRGADARPGGVFGREWWGLDRDRLEDELAEQERDRSNAAKPH